MDKYTDCNFHNCPHTHKCQASVLQRLVCLQQSITIVMHMSANVNRCIPCMQLQELDNTVTLPSPSACICLERQ